MVRLVGWVGLVLLSGASAFGQFEQRALDGWEGADKSAFATMPPGAGFSFDEAAALAGEGQAESLLIAVDGRLVYERYWNGRNRDSLQQMYSATKGPFAFLIGRAIEQGHIRSLDQAVTDYVPEFKWNGREMITFRQVLGMVSGLDQTRELDEADARAKRSQLEAALLRRTTHKPNEHYHYNNAAYRLLFTALEKATGKSLNEYSQEELFAPLGMTGARWVELVEGEEHKRYQSIRMRPLDMLKVGQLMLDLGEVNGERYLPVAYIQALMAAPAPEVNPSYGLFWHLNGGGYYLSYYESERMEGELLPGTPHDAIINYGNNGQIVCAVPSLNLTWVRTGQSIPSTLWERDSHVAKLSAAIAATVSGTPGNASDSDWLTYGKDEQGRKYSGLTQINRRNVHELEVAWTHHHGDMKRGEWETIGYETTPLAWEGRLYFTTPFGKIIAVDGATGRELWDFTPVYDVEESLKQWAVNRGVALWRKGEKALLFVAPIDGRLYCVDARTGEPVRRFGNLGSVDAFRSLSWSHMGSRGAYSYTMPPTVFEDLIILGSQIADSPAITRPPGAILAFHAETGELVWSHYTIPREGEPGSETWLKDSRALAGSANVWTKMSVDAERGLLYAPTSTPNSDFYGGHRPGDNLYAETLLCLDARTGERKWHFQTVHHGIWDYDINSQPSLLDIEVNGTLTPVVAQLSKTGFCYVFNRVTGEPIWPIEERVVPQTDVPGEWTSSTQPFPTKPPAITQQGFTVENLANLEAGHHARALEAFAKYKSGPLFTPPSLEGTLTAPGYQGGASWGGGAYDPVTGYLITNANNMPVVLGLKRAPEDSPLRYVPQSNRFIDPETGVPFTKPPWGTLTAINLKDGTLAWQVPLGIDPDVAKLGLDPEGTGAFNRGGPIVTAGGLVFMGGTEDGYFRAFDSSTGEKLFEHKLPFFAASVPMTYAIDGRQYVAIASGGHSRMHTEFDDRTHADLGDALVVFALPVPK